MDYLGETLIVIVAILAIFIVSAWVMKDAGERGKSGCLVVLMVLCLSAIPGLLVWLVFRPPKIPQKPVDIPDESSDGTPESDA